MLTETGLSLERCDMLDGIAVQREMLLAEIKIRVPEDHKTFGKKPITLLSIYQDPLLDEKTGDDVLELLAEYTITSRVYTWFDGGLFVIEPEKDSFDDTSQRKFFASVASDVSGMRSLSEYLIKTLTSTGLGVLLHTLVTGSYAMELSSSDVTKPAEIDFGTVWQIKELEVFLPAKNEAEERLIIIPITDS